MLTNIPKIIGNAKTLFISKSEIYETENIVWTQVR